MNCPFCNTLLDAQAGTTDFFWHPSNLCPMQGYATARDNWNRFTRAATLLNVAHQPNNQQIRKAS